jgi:hypothetical protein
LRLNVSITNTGTVLLPLASGKVKICRVRPWPNDLVTALANGRTINAKGPRMNPIEWAEVAARDIEGGRSFKEIEPGETDNYYFDSIVDGNLQTIFIWTYFYNQAKGGRIVGWNTTSTHELH